MILDFYVVLMEDWIGCYQKVYIYRGHPCGEEAHVFQSTFFLPDNQINVPGTTNFTLYRILLPIARQYYKIQGFVAETIPKAIPNLRWGQFSINKHTHDLLAPKCIMSLSDLDNSVQFMTIITPIDFYVLQSEKFPQ